MCTVSDIIFLLFLFFFFSFPLLFVLCVCRLKRENIFIHAHYAGWILHAVCQTAGAVVAAVVEITRA